MAQDRNICRLRDERYIDNLEEHFKIHDNVLVAQKASYDKTEARL